MKSARTFPLVGSLPFVGFGLTAAAVAKAVHDFGQAGDKYSGTVLGTEMPIVVGIGSRASSPSRPSPPRGIP